jgi:hypothetical protein
LGSQITLEQAIAVAGDPGLQHLHPYQLIPYLERVAREQAAVEVETEAEVAESSKDLESTKSTESDPETLETSESTKFSEGESEEFQQGREASLSGESPSSNPYDGRSKGGREWNRGFQSLGREPISDD